MIAWLTERLPMDVSVALGALFFALFCALIAGIMEYARGRRDGVAEIDPEVFAMHLYASLVPRGRPWAAIPDSLRDIYREHADYVLDRLNGVPR